MEEITITVEDMALATAKAMTNGLKELIDVHPANVLLIPIVTRECWCELLKMKGEGNDERKAD